MCHVTKSHHVLAANLKAGDGPVGESEGFPFSVKDRREEGGKGHHVLPLLQYRLSRATWRAMLPTLGKIFWPRSAEIQFNRWKKISFL
jgi:hypothetical protein